jgi:hypothetical protein
MARLVLHQNALSSQSTILWGEMPCSEAIATTLAVNHTITYCTAKLACEIKTGLLWNRLEEQVNNID